MNLTEDREEPEDKADPALPESQPLGASWDGQGTTFRVFSEHATAMELCLFDACSGEETGRSPMERSGPPGVGAGLWELRAATVGPGQLYGFRAQGPYEPRLGHRFNPAKLLFDPYARSYRGEARFHRSLEDHPPATATGAEDSAPFVPKAQVVDPAFDWGEDAAPAIPWEETVLYEAHVKGLTALCPHIPRRQRGTFSGLAHPAVLEHLLSLGVTSVELLPVFFSISEKRLESLGLVNYWGYNTLGFFAPDRRFSATDDAATELKAAVRALHEAGLEVILDVAFNHSAEGGRNGLVLSFKGLDNLSYYRRHAEDGSYENLSGCGNTLDIRHPRVLGLVLDSLRYWVREFHIDGFRFDLAPILGRHAPEDPSPFDPAAPFFEALGSDPVLSAIKCIAEPWDLGAGGYNLGRFPGPIAQWNDRYRDTVRRFWRGDPGQLPHLATRLAGSADLFSSPARSINFVTCHDGFTLRDLVSYEQKHNLANGEDGRDGHSESSSRNWGEEGPTSSAGIEKLRSRAQRNFLATLAFSRGIPMLSHGDEFGRSQEGNNNAYCHDGPLTWMRWPEDSAARRPNALEPALRESAFQEPAVQDLRAFMTEIFQLRRAHPVLRRGDFFLEAPSPAQDGLRWLSPSGLPLAVRDWGRPEARSVAALFTPRESSAEAPLLLLLNAAESSRSFVLPPPPDGDPWTVLLDSASYPSTPGSAADLEPYSLRLLVSSAGRSNVQRRS